MAENINGEPRNILRWSQELRKSKRCKYTVFNGLIFLPHRTIKVALRYENAQPLLVLDGMTTKLSEQHKNYYENQHPKFQGRLESDLNRFDIALTLDKLTKPSRAKITMKYLEKY